MAAISYNLEKRLGGKTWAVIRTGPRGGKKVIGVYIDRGSADRVLTVHRQTLHYEARQGNF